LLLATRSAAPPKRSKKYSITAGWRLTHAKKTAVFPLLLATWRQSGPSCETIHLSTSRWS